MAVMPTDRAVPWAGLVGALGESRFEEVRSALAQEGVDPESHDAFVLAGIVGHLLRDLVPEDAPAEAIESYGALLHMLYLNWLRGWPVRTLDRERLSALLAAPPPIAGYAPSPSTCYIQLGERLIWAAPAEGAPHEPLDGAFVAAFPAELRVLAVLGFRPEREGFTTIATHLPLPAPEPAARPDGSPPFASVLPGGDRAKLFSLVSEAELAALALLALRATGG